MKSIHVSLLILFCGAGVLSAQNPVAYTLFTSTGKKSDFKKLSSAAAKADVVLFGELHNNPIAHWLQLKLTQEMIARRSAANVVLGAEMFEADNQEALNQYLSGEITEDTLKKRARLWPNYETDYKPLVDVAATHKIPFIATNIPRKYARMVSKGGFGALDTLSQTAQSWMAPLPMAFDSSLECYSTWFAEAMGGHMAPNMAKAQASKDATMAHFILKNHTPGKLFIHYNGSFHSDRFQSISWYLKHSGKPLKILVISTREQAQTSKLDKENKNYGDFILCIPEDMCKTY